MVSLYIDESDCDLLGGSGRESALCELRCGNCGEGMKYDQQRCVKCGEVNLRFRVLEDLARN